MPKIRVVAWLWLVACGGGDGADSALETGASTGTPAAETTVPAETTDTAWECNPWYPCQECGGVVCAAEINACAGDGTCGDALNAWASCVLACGNPEACAETFVADGGAPAASLEACARAGCSEDCDLAP